MIGRRGRHPLTVALAAVGLLLLVVPLVVVAVQSVNAARHGLAWEGFSLKWYQALGANARIRAATVNTLIVAVASTAISTVLGTLLAIGLERFPSPRWFARWVDAAVDLPVVTPDILFAAALVIAFAFFRKAVGHFPLGLPTMIVGHVTFQISFVALVVRSRLVVIGPTLAEAASDLDASLFYAFRRVTFPLIRPAIVAGAVLAFTLSLDDFIISFFMAGTGVGTLPIEIYASLRRGLSPEIHALSTLIVLATVVLVLALERASRGSPATPPPHGDVSR